MAFPYLAESWCPWCERTIQNPRLTRLHDEGAEYECAICGQRHVRKEGENDLVYFFFPGDIYRLFSEDVKPFDLGWRFRLRQ